MDAPKSVRYSIYERALEKLPRSYKLWHLYLTERITECKGRSLRDPLYEETNNAFERALVHMHKMPVIWTMFLDFQTSQKRITSTRRNFDRALCALPITQHTKFVWPGYLRFADECGVAETAMRIWRRYIKISPKEREEYIAHLRRANRLDEAAKQLAAIINDESFVSQQGRAKHDLWTDLLKLIVRHPLEVTSIDVEAVIRSGIRKYPHEVARLWTSLADYYIRLGTMERARDIYAEAIDAVLTVRDFSIVYQAYTKFEETLIATRMKELDLLEAAAAGDPAALKELAGGAQGRKWTRAQIAEEQESLSTEIDMRMMRLSKLVDSRPLLLNSVLLRQNPHSVEEWLNRVKLCGSDILRTVQTYTQAVSTVDPAKADGKLHILWVRFALFYASKGQISDARTIFDRAVNVEYRTVDALAHVYCRWIEMELLHKYPDEAIAVAQRACHPPKDYRAHKPGHFTDTSIHVAERVYRHPKLWSFLVDLQESFGSLESTRAVYERMIQLRVITPQMILNYARLLEEKNFFEESFRVYEKGIAIFPYPHVAPIWLAYLRKFTQVCLLHHHLCFRLGDLFFLFFFSFLCCCTVASVLSTLFALFFLLHSSFLPFFFPSQRYGGRKIERTRDLFEQATAAAPAEHARKLYLLYAKFEEAHGLGRSVTKVYERAVKAVPEKERLDMYFVYIARVTDLFGAIKTREIYDEAMQSLPDADIPLLALRYSSLERALGDIDRARAIFTYAAQSCDPAKDPNFWNEFKLFETQHGNEDTFRDMVKVSQFCDIRKFTSVHILFMIIIFQLVHDCHFSHFRYHVCWLCFLLPTYLLFIHVAVLSPLSICSTRSRACFHFPSPPPPPPPLADSSSSAGALRTVLCRGCRDGQGCRGDANRQGEGRCRGQYVIGGRHA